MPTNSLSIDRQPRHISGLDTAVGVAYCGYVDGLLQKSPGLIDFVEIPFELLIRDATPAAVSNCVPIVLHSASLSVAGNVRPSETIAAQLADWVGVTQTPWIGEHLAFIRAAPPHPVATDPAALLVDEQASVFDVGYTVSPQYSDAVLDRVVSSLADAHARFDVPVLLENGPMYFPMPGSTMTQVEFIRGLCGRVPTARLLLDLSHLWVTAENLGLDVFETLAALPLDRVVEVHLSGASLQSGYYWDDHSRRAAPVLYELLEEVMTQTIPHAVTLEYNWDERFPLDGLREDIAKVREIVASG